MTTSTGQPVVSSSPPKIWWSNAIFFLSIHLAALVGIYFWPPYAVARATLLLSFAIWQLADFGITVGYHRLFSHRAYKASFGVRATLAILGSAGFQGSIKWWCLRHRLHHRFTDDLTHDPYAATRGLFYSHVGWIFYKPTYTRMELVDRADLENDPVVRFQHKYYVPMALFFGFIAPTLLGALWNDALGAFIWGGLVSRLAIWHCTFLVNSLAHWDGLQPYSDEDTSRGNLLLALLTGGEGNHNFHAFPHDFRSGPSVLDWDPSKWIILVLHRLGLASSLRRARMEDISDAKLHMRHKHDHGAVNIVHPPPPDDLERWEASQVKDYIRQRPANCIIIVDNFIVDVTTYLGEHPGGSQLFRKYSIKSGGEWVDATWAFEGGLNNHSRAARRRLNELIIAQLKA